MSHWILILYIYAGTWAHGDSVALINVTGFSTEAVCNEAGEKAKRLADGSMKVARFVCVHGDVSVR